LAKMVEIILLKKLIYGIIQRMKIEILPVIGLGSLQAKMREFEQGVPRRDRVVVRVPVPGEKGLCYDFVTSRTLLAIRMKRLENTWRGLTHRERQRAEENGWTEALYVDGLTRTDLFNDFLVSQTGVVPPLPLD